MERKKISLISMIVFMTVFSLTAIFDIQTPIHNSKNKATESDKVMVAKSSDEAKNTKAVKIQSFSTDNESTGDVNTLTPGAENPDVSGVPTEAPALTPTLTPSLTPTPSPSPTPTPTPEPTEAPKPKYNDIGISIAKDYVNIRKSPSTKGESLGKLYRNAAAKILKTKDDWCYVESGSVKGYIKKELLKTGIPDDEIVKYGTLSISVDVDGLNVRKEPSMDAKKITTIYQDETYPVKDQKDDWIKIDLPDEKIDGYVKKEFVEIEIEFKDAVSKAEELKIQQLKAEARAKKETVIKHGNGFDYTNEDLKLLACLIHAEAGHQSYECKLAVANIVLNRVKSYRASFSAVIYSPGQFSVASSGSLQKQLDRFGGFGSQSELLSVKAATDALGGANNIGERRFFHSYAAAVSKGYDQKPESVKLGGLLFW